MNQIFRLLRKKIVALLVLLLINALFVYKYSIEFGQSSGLFALLYFFIFLFIYLLFKKIQSRLFFKLGFFAMLVLAFVSMFLLLHFVDPYSVNPDRWSAIYFFNEKLLSGEFPYAAQTHMGQSVSGMPFLFLMVLPFQLVGDVGYFQLFVYGLLAFSIWFYFREWKIRFIVLFYLLASPFYWWEIYVRSDLSSNLFLFVLFVLFIDWCCNTEKEKNWFFIAIAVGLFASTRGVLLLPFIVYFFNYFRNKRLKSIVKFGVVSLIVLVLTVLPFFFWDSKTMIENNPLILQTNKSPWIFMLMAIALSIFLGFKRKDFATFCFYSGCCILALVLANFVRSWVEWGWEIMIFKDKIDISYLSMCLPFFLFAFDEKKVVTIRKR